LPRNTEVQASLVRTATSTAARANLRLDSSAQDYLGALIADAAGRIETEDALDSPEALDHAEKAFETLIRKTAADQLKATGERRGYASPPPSLVSEASLQSALAGICPIWPIC
jgi:hypothetical protein